MPSRICSGTPPCTTFDHSALFGRSTTKNVERSALMIAVTFSMMRGSNASTFSVELTAQAMSMIASSCFW